MSKPSLDTKTIFSSLPTALLVLTPDLTIVAATDYYYELTFSEPSDLVGRNIAEVFPENPVTAKAKGINNMRESFDYVLRHGASHTIPVQRYDIKLPPNHKGKYMERWWRITNSPVFNAKGELLYVVHATEDVSQIVDTLIEAQNIIAKKRS
ncbi:MAG: histidine kinase [Candidatus Saccharibacteria bacterium]|nr:histidine kinase [Candidatus Saccharibacteria bacterium]